MEKPTRSFWSRRIPLTYKVEISGSKEFDSLAKKLKRRADGSLEKLLADGAITTQSNAKEAILSHQSKGIIYKRGSVTHQASTAGNPPNSDTGVLVNNITIQKIPGGYDVGSRKGAPHGFWLEFGTSKMEARPWLTPSFDKAVKVIIAAAKRIGSI